jgi:hypothetical protein
MLLWIDEVVVNFQGCKMQFTAKAQWRGATAEIMQSFAICVLTICGEAQSLFIPEESLFFDHQGMRHKF